MHNFQRLLKIKLSVCLTVFIFLISSYSSLKAATYEILFEGTVVSSMGEEQIKKELMTCLEKKPFYPALRDRDTTFTVIETEDTYSTLYIRGTLTQGDYSLIGVFGIQKGWFSNTTDLCYMSTDPDYLPNPTLFNDVCYFTEKLLPKNRSSYHIVIQKENNSTQEMNKHLWTFYNENERIEILVICVPRPEVGGTDIYITPSK